MDKKKLIKKFISIKGKCCQELCPQHGKCDELPTEYYNIKDNEQIDIMFIGQGGGATEAKLNRPFVGPAGKRLKDIIVHIWKTRDFLPAFSNTVRCRPTYKNKNRPPSKSEEDNCVPILWDDIDELGPRVIMLLGKPAIQGILPEYADGNFSITRLHGTAIRNSLNTFIISIHPSFIIRQHGNKFNSEMLGEYDNMLINDINKALDIIDESKT